MERRSDVSLEWESGPGFSPEFFVNNLSWLQRCFETLNIFPSPHWASVSPFIQ